MQSEFISFLVAKDITLDTTGGYASWLNGKVERPHRTIAAKVRAMLYNSGLSNKFWCYAAESAADTYRYTFHSALQKTPYEAWYGIKPNINHFRVWGCIVYVRVPHPKKLDDRVSRGYFLGFSKSRLIIHWLDPSSNTVKHASAFRFDEYNTKRQESDTLSPGALILADANPGNLPLESSITILDHPHLESQPFTIQVLIPPLGSPIGCVISSDTYHNLPYICEFTPGTALASSLLLQTVN